MNIKEKLILIDVINNLREALNPCHDLNIIIAINNQRNILKNLIGVRMKEDYEKEKYKITDFNIIYVQDHERPDLINGAWLICPICNKDILVDTHFILNMKDVSKLNCEHCKTKFRF